MAGPYLCAKAAVGHRYMGRDWADRGRARHRRRIGPWPPPLADWLDSATTTELRLSSGAESERADRLLEDRLRGPKPIS